MRDRLTALALFAVISSLCYATSAGITSSNDGSHYALLRAMADEGRFRIETYAHFAEGNDLAIRDGVIYSDRPPGTALLGIPFYVVGGLLPPPIQALPTRHDEGNPRLAYLLMLPALAAGGVVAVVYQLLRACRLPAEAALTASIALGTGSTLFKYGGVLFSHALSALLVVSGVALALSAGRAGRLKPAAALALGLTLGLSLTVEYSNVLFVAIVLLYLVLSLKGRLMRRPNRAAAALLAAALALPIGFLLAYHTVSFGGPLTTSYRYAINYPWAASLRTTFDVPLSQGLPGMLWYGHDARGEENQGLLLLMPITLAAAGGLWPYLRSWGREAALTLGLFGVYLVLFATHHTFSGFTADGRYLMPFLPLWFLPLGFAIAEIHTLRPSARRAALLLFVYGLLFLSVRNMLAHIAFSYNYHLDPGLVARRAATPANWSYLLGDVFVNWPNLPLLWLVEAAALGMLAGLGRLRQIIRPH